jgi:hypothetical protein
MSLGIIRRREALGEPRAQQLEPKPGAADRVQELTELESLKDAGVISEAEYNRQRGQILAELI